jgi:aldehyde dehydrogenase (NAD+)
MKYRYIDEGKKGGAKIELGGKRFGNVGYFIEPTIFSNVHEDMKIMQEEIFGPVCSIASFKTEEDAIAMANKTNYGLSAGIHTTNLNTMARVSAGLNAGTIWVNTYNNLHHQLPFGGFKQSGIGKELGEAALAGYTKAKTITARLTGPIF